MAENKPADARKRYEAILKVESKNVRAMVALAELAEKEGKTEEYLSWLDKAVKADPNAIQPRQLLARYYVEQKQGDKALALAREANAANPDSPAALSLLGKTQLSIGQNENALVSFTRLIQQNPTSADAHYHLGLAQRNLNRTDAARASLQKALELQPTYLPAQETLIALEIASGRTDAALRIAAVVQAQQPKSPLGASLEGDIHLAAKNYSKAAQAFERASALSSSNTLTVKRHQALALAGDDKAADAVTRQWLAKHPDDLFVRAYLSRHYLLSGRDQEAIAAHEWLLKKAPRDDRLLNNLAWLYQKTGDARALPTAEAAYKLAPESPAIQDTLGWLLVQGKDAKRGLDLLTKAAAGSDSQTVRYHYAAALAKTGDKAKARQELERLLKSDKPFSERAQAESLLKSL
jgi:putative PEP-CTERM system TPR-repeat lipoprotein